MMVGFPSRHGAAIALRSGWEFSRCGGEEVPDGGEIVLGDESFGEAEGGDGREVEEEECGALAEFDEVAPVFVEGLAFVISDAEAVFGDGDVHAFLDGGVPLPEVFDAVAELEG